MSSPFVGEIKVWAGNFAPTGYATCAGQLLPISQNTALFSLLGTMYGGDGKSTFALPDLQGRVPLHVDNSQYFQGEQAGSDSVTLIEAEMARHNHVVNVNQVDTANLTQPGPNRIIAQSRNGNAFQTSGTDNAVAMNPNAISVAGQTQPHSNQQPYLVLNYIIALQGVFPQRP
ncbi:tail fiber protein [Conexibacter sp. JD483]|uniref:phage tail protein n=1 Tax=unclassified Conexibacter TaxID=2627773 RepID=UPI0027237BD6|nr:MULTISPECIES: tail fiber protein [unclassified Conexibacter]MDO8186377.1 tail fiber protein [Conexibacter sp. CPCC 205706]MDO8199776.1 tail fiber protein [Conexibacter sp. CPCC 205762]MDR9371131.1 tail fiber protein [Conexibacter sp. JD483]